MPPGRTRSREPLVQRPALRHEVFLVHREWNRRLTTRTGTTCSSRSSLLPHLSWPPRRFSRSWAALRRTRPARPRPTPLRRRPSTRALPTRALPMTAMPRRRPPLARPLRLACTKSRTGRANAPPAGAVRMTAGAVRLATSVHVRAISGTPRWLNGAEPRISWGGGPSARLPHAITMPSRSSAKTVDCTRYRRGRAPHSSVTIWNGSRVAITAVGSRVVTMAVFGSSGIPVETPSIGR